MRHDARVPIPTPSRRATAPLLAAAPLLLTACQPLPGDGTDSGGAPVLPPAAVGNAPAALARLPVSSASHAGYRRSLFGGGWLDLDGNGCDTREEVLRRDLQHPVLRNACIVLSGVLTDPYSGVTVRFRRGQETSADVQVDHVVALADAWRTGAWQWTRQRREEFANDPGELLAVAGDENQAKGDDDAARWLPSRPQARCSYVARQIAVKARWGLSVRPAERDAMQRVLATCPDQPLPRG